MAVKYVQEDNPLNSVGGLMTLGGAFIPNAGLLAPLGMGISATTGGLNSAQETVLGKIMDRVMSGEGNAWMKPAWMNPAKNTTAKKSGKTEEQELADKWGAYVNRGYSW